MDSLEQRGLISQKTQATPVWYDDTTFSSRSYPCSPPWKRHDVWPRIVVSNNISKQHFSTRSDALDHGDVSVTGIDHMNLVMCDRTGGSHATVHATEKIVQVVEWTTLRERIPQYAGSGATTKCTDVYQGSNMTRAAKTERSIHAKNPWQSKTLSRTGRTSRNR